MEQIISIEQTGYLHFYNPIIMTDSEILQRAVEKAEKSGYKDEGLIRYTNEAKNSFAPLIFDHSFAKDLFGKKQELIDDSKCWGDKEETEWLGDKNAICLHCGFPITQRNPSGYCDHLNYPESCKVCLAKTQDWKYHIQQLALAEDRLKYLEQFLD